MAEDRKQPITAFGKAFQEQCLLVETLGIVPYPEDMPRGGSNAVDCPGRRPVHGEPGQFIHGSEPGNCRPHTAAELAERAKAEENDDPA